MVVELKVKVKDEKALRAKLNKMAKFFSEVKVKDIYFNSKENTNLKLGIYPKGTLPREGIFILFYKHNKETKNFEFKEVRVENAEDMLYILDNILGIKIVIEKIRTFYKIENIIISIDSIENLGNFLILQGDDRNKLLNLLKKLGFDESKLITKSFDMLLLNQ